MNKPIKGDADVICGGPPCQGISGFNRFRNTDSPLDDPKNQQLVVYMDIVNYLKPRYVLIENVVDILRFAGGFLARYALGRLVGMNYQARMGLMAAGAYGLPQFRMRMFMWGAHNMEKLPQYPLPTHNVVVRGNTPTEFEQIHALIMSLNYTGVEIKTAHSLESWNGGVLVLVSGSVHLKDFNGRRNFVQTFFLAPQETGYFVLNDIFHFIEEDQIHQHPIAYLAPRIHDSKLNASTATREQVSNYMLGGDFQAREFVIPANVEQNGRVDNYSFPEQRLQQVPETENILEDNFAVQSNGSLQSTLNPVREHLSTPVEETVGEPQKHTYASILQVAKGQSAPAVPAQSSFNKITPPGSEWNHVSEPSSQPAFAPSVTVDMFRTEAVEEVSAIEDEGEIKSVYVRNVPSTASAFEIEEEFKKFGKLKPDGVAIRTRKDIDVCYAFVEFEDIVGVQNAIKASTVQIAGQQVYVEGRRANRINVFRGGRGRGRGSGSYHMDASRGHSGARNFSRGSGQDGDYSRPKGNGNGYYRPTPRQERPFSGSQQVSRNGSNLSK